MNKSSELYECEKCNEHTSTQDYYYCTECSSTCDFKSNGEFVCSNTIEDDSGDRYNSEYYAAYCPYHTCKSYYVTEVDGCLKCIDDNNSLKGQIFCSVCSDKFTISLEVD